MRARADAAVIAIKDAFGALDADASANEMCDSAADAALLAYDRVADAETKPSQLSCAADAALLAFDRVDDDELAQRERSTDGTNDGQGPNDGPNSTQPKGTPPLNIPVSDAVLKCRIGTPGESANAGHAKEEVT
eukprot:gene3610-13694_t